MNPNHPSLPAARPMGLSEVRLRRLLWVGAVIVALIGAQAGGHTLLAGYGQLALLPLVGVVIAALTVAAVQRGWLQQAALFLVLAGAVPVVVSALWIDLPTAQTPRTVHLYLLPMMAMAHWVLAGRTRAVRWSVQLSLLATLLALAGTPPAPEAFNPLTAPQRTFLAWVTIAIVLGQLAFIAHLVDADWLERSDLELDLARALASGQLGVHLQAQCDGEGRLVGAEALVRWHDAQRGWVPPALFVPLAERGGLVLALGEQVLQHTLRLQARWKREQSPLSGLPVAVNLSALQWQDDAHLDALLDRVSAQALPPGSVKFELTESVMVADVASVCARLERCRALGVTTALDDFGTGYASLSLLSRLPFEELKIDRSFVQDLGDNARSHKIARTVVELGQKLGMEVTAEGVETAEQVRLLRSLGCLRFQGYHFARPMAPEAFEAWALARLGNPGKPDGAGAA